MDHRSGLPLLTVGAFEDRLPLQRSLEELNDVKDLELDAIKSVVELDTPEVLSMVVDTAIGRVRTGSGGSKSRRIVPISQAVRFQQLQSVVHLGSVYLHLIDYLLLWKPSLGQPTRVLLRGKSTHFVKGEVRRTSITRTHSSEKKACTTFLITFIAFCSSLSMAGVRHPANKKWP
jgi:hypothetical protein